MSNEIKLKSGKDMPDDVNTKKYYALPVDSNPTLKEYVDGHSQTEVFENKNGKFKAVRWNGTMCKEMVIGEKSRHVRIKTRQSHTHLPVKRGDYIGYFIQTNNLLSIECEDFVAIYC